MKKLLFIVALAALTISGYAQKKPGSVLVKAGYQTEYKRIGLAVQGRYDVVDRVRVAPEAQFLFPHANIVGFNINVDAQYLVGARDGFAFYPLAGFSMINNRWSNSGNSTSSTDFGFNLGAGADYTLKENKFLNAEFRYTFSKTDFAYISLGYGIKF